MIHVSPLIPKAKVAKDNASENLRLVIAILLV
jgi:hypothetical protein